MEKRLIAGDCCTSAARVGWVLAGPPTPASSLPRSKIGKRNSCSPTLLLPQSTPAITALPGSSGLSPFVHVSKGITMELIQGPGHPLLAPDGRAMVAAIWRAAAAGRRQRRRLQHSCCGALIPRVAFGQPNRLSAAGLGHAQQHCRSLEAQTACWQACSACRPLLPLTATSGLRERHGKHQGASVSRADSCWMIGRALEAIRACAQRQGSIESSRHGRRMLCCCAAPHRRSRRLPPAAPAAHSSGCCPMRPLFQAEHPSPARLLHYAHFSVWSPIWRAKRECVGAQGAGRPAGGHNNKRRQLEKGNSSAQVGIIVVDGELRVHVHSNSYDFACVQGRGLRACPSVPP